MDVLTKHFCHNLRTLRVQRALSQAALAEQADLSEAYISQLERGASSPPFPTLVALARVLRIRPELLIQDLGLEPLPDLRHSQRKLRSA